MRPRDTAGTAVPHTHMVQVTCDRSQDRLHAKEEAAVGVFRTPTLCSGLTEAKRSFGFLLWGGYAHLNQMKKEKKRKEGFFVFFLWLIFNNNSISKTLITILQLVFSVF